MGGMTRSTAAARIAIDVTTDKVQQRLQSIFPEHRLVPASPRAPGTFSAVFFEINDDDAYPVLEQWVERAVPTVIVARKNSDHVVKHARALGAADGLMLPLDRVRTRLALQHLLAIPETNHADLPTLNLAVLERMAIDEALRRTNRSFVAAAQLLGVGRSTLYRRVPELFPEE
ncbi:hypothetical protein BH09MYX1_BH09MYX1_20990 [soil metagenome]